jgi:hypothetical protein
VRALPVLALLLACAPLAKAQTGSAGDASALGPSPVVTADYALGATVMPDVLEGCTPTVHHDCRTELRARIHRPERLSGRHPLVVVLHGNHATCGRPYAPPPAGTDRPGLAGNPRIDDTCDYTTRGTCPPGYVTPDGVPNHLGYDYLATRLASHGYVVVSIDANRGITCMDYVPGVGDVWLIRSRGRLVLKHLELLSRCHRTGATGVAACDALKGRLDFRNVGFLGHSRGGEGVRAAFELYRAPRSPWRSKIRDPIVVRGIFEISPSDKHRDLDVDGVAWNVLLPMCDADTSDQAGRRPFDRVLRNADSADERKRPSPKSTYTVWGANHNFYNTEWQTRDLLQVDDAAAPPICGGLGNTALFGDSPGSPAQRLTALASVLAFFRAHVGRRVKAGFAGHFDPLVDTPGTVRDEANVERPYPQRVDRGYTISPARTAVLEDFTQPTGTNPHGSANTHGTNLTVEHRRGLRGVDDDDQRLGAIAWTVGAADTFFQTNWAAGGHGRNASAWATLDFRVARQSAPANAADTTDFSVQLASADGTLSGALPVSRYLLRTPLTGPVGATLLPILQTARIPLADFPGWSRVKGTLRGVRFVFDRTNAGAILLANVTLSRRAGSNVRTRRTRAAPPSSPAPRTTSAAPVGPRGAAAQASIVEIRPGAAPDPVTGEATVEVVLASARRFTPRAQGLVLWIGRHAFDRSFYAAGDLRRPVFVLTASQAAALENGAPVAVTYGDTATGPWWSGGSFAAP